MSPAIRRMLKYGGIEFSRWLFDELKRGERGTLGPRGRRIRLAIVSDRAAWCSEQQFYPIDTHRDRLEREYGISYLNVYLDQKRRYPPINLKDFDAVLIKLSYQTKEHIANSIIDSIRQEIGDIPLIYMDGDDDLCIQWNHVIATSDVYVKSHAFVDRLQYQRQFTGKSNLHDYAVNHFGHTLTEKDYTGKGDDPVFIPHSGVVDTEDLNKITVGWNLGLAQDITQLWSSIADTAPPEKTIDCAFRGSVKYDTITGYMRGNCVNHLKALSERYNVSVSADHLSLSDYYKELLSSRVCVSPFGFGELCWRDFEAAICRSMLIKPDMSHIETQPNIFQPHVTYVPVKWDLSDLEEICAYYFDHEDERAAIAERAFQVVDDYYRNMRFAESFERILKKAGVR